MDTSRAVADKPAHESPALLHHFATEGQQKNAASLGMWVFLAQEVMFFGGMFCAYLVYRYKYFADFGSGSLQLDIRLGTTNTVVLICSSLTVVLAIRAVQLGKRRALVFWLVATILLGLAFLGIKADEYAEKFEKHHVPGPSFSYHELIPG
ncbi:MAG TPA: cytochrome c oxidase subunit 3, partial [Candidatus Acidoferrales bacterium]|nr:cytochrome c oxidase subunit 3 [Candidatus Acidoferrales bacterium]